MVYYAPAMNYSAEEYREMAQYVEDLYGPDIEGCDCDTCKLVAMLREAADEQERNAAEIKRLYNECVGRTQETLGARREAAEMREALEKIAVLDITLDAPMGDNARLQQAVDIARRAIQGDESHE